MTIKQTEKVTKEEPLDPNDSGPTPQDKLEKLLADIRKEKKQ